MDKKMVSLIILDGFGINERKEGNAVAAANKPFIDSLFEKYPSTVIRTSGMDVGLPDGQMGNSEVGHTNIGAGRIVYQELTRITKAIKDGSFYENKELIKAIDNCKKNDSKLHLYGLLSDGGVHSHNNHLYALLKLAKKSGLEEVYVHCFFDGRDVPPASSDKYVMQLEEKLKEIGVGKIATIMGRYYAMDRDNRWERTKLAYDAMTKGVGDTADSALEGVKSSYEKKVNDEFIIPCVICEEGKPVAKIEDQDSIIFYNFRPDRARQITKAFTEDDFNEFERDKLDLVYVCMTQYDKTFKNVHVAFKPQTLENTFGEYISKKGLTQLRIAETEKYAHVTFFFNGGVEKAYKNEDRILVPSPKVATYDMQPEMSAFEVADKAAESVNSGKYDVMILNFANPDMVGHTGDLEAAIAAVEAVDKALEKVVTAIEKQGGIALITADHGNSEQLLDYETNEPFTAHTTNPVPLIAVGLDKNTKISEGRLADLAPTMLKLLGLEKPEEMTGKSILR